MKQYYSVFTGPLFFVFMLALLLIGSTRTWQVTGTLVSDSDAPIADHQVYLYNSDEEQIASDRTDDQGRFTLTYQTEPTSADPGTGPESPSEFKLGASYPNPFNPRTTVPFYAPENTRASIAVYNIIGQEVLRSQADISVGSNEIQVNLGGRLSQGQYTLRVQGDGFSLAQGMTFISAGIGGGTPEIRVQQGGRTSARISGSIRQMDDEMEYRVIVEETDRFHGKEVMIAPFENLDMGFLVIAVKHQDYGDWHRDTVTVVVEVTNPATDRVWMDRNLGASRAVTSSTDQQSYGDYYQWGRLADGHQIIHRFEGDGKTTSGTTETLSSSDQPGHGSLILSNSEANWDWRSLQNDNLWQGVNGINNPCPIGFRLPTEAEWNAERGSWSKNDASGAVASPLKLPMAGRRSGSNGSLGSDGSLGYYWSSTVSGSRARSLGFGGNAAMYSDPRASGRSVRCIKD